jgi:hypothetical protein
MREIWSSVTFSLKKVIPLNRGAACASVLCLGLLTQVLSPDLKASPQGYTGDNSDWWSVLRTDDSDESMTFQKREPAASNFRILTISLGEDMFKQAAAKLGAAGKIQRGDAASGREQACYVSPGNSKLVHLIFEQGEVNYSFYLFADEPDWQGSEKCLPSQLISRGLSTASGLHLGQTPSEVRAVLGKPSVRRKNQFIYSFLVKKRTSVKDLKEARIHNPEMSDQEFHANYNFYDLTVGIDARFADSKLSFLAVSKAETY